MYHRYVSTPNRRLNCNDLNLIYSCLRISGPEPTAMLMFASTINPSPELRDGFTKPIYRDY